MSEYELLDVLAGHVEIMISLLQWWAGITLGLLVGVHVIGKELNILMVGLLLSLYVAFTAAISFLETAHMARMQLIITSLKKLQDQGVALSDMSAAIIGSAGPPVAVQISAALGFWGLFLATIGYVIYRYRKAKVTIT